MEVKSSTKENIVNTMFLNSNTTFKKKFIAMLRLKLHTQFLILKDDPTLVG